MKPKPRVPHSWELPVCDLEMRQKCISFVQKLTFTSFQPSSEVGNWNKILEIICVCNVTLTSVYFFQETRSQINQPSTSIGILGPPKTKKKLEDLQSELMFLAKEHFKKSENEFEIMAKKLVFKRERIDKNQRKLAAKF